MMLREQIKSKKKSADTKMIQPRWDEGIRWRFKLATLQSSDPTVPSQCLLIQICHKAALIWTSCTPSAHQHIHFSRAVRSNPVPQHNGNTCSNKTGSFTPCFHSKLLFGCCNNVVNSSKALTTCSNSPMSQLTAAGTLIKPCEPVLLETMAGKYYYTNASQGKLVLILSCAARQYMFTLRAPLWDKRHS